MIRQWKRESERGRTGNFPEINFTLRIRLNWKASGNGLSLSLDSYVGIANLWPHFDLQPHTLGGGPLPHLTTEISGEMTSVRYRIFLSALNGETIDYTGILPVAVFVVFQLSKKKTKKKKQVSVILCPAVITLTLDESKVPSSRPLTNSNPWAMTLNLLFKTFLLLYTHLNLSI